MQGQGKVGVVRRRWHDASRYIVGKS